jgi:two-component system NtrC family sensor kinase
LIADVDQLRGILLNLLLNAAQAMPNGGEIRVRTEAAEIPSRIRIRISDTGTGIPPDVQAKLFTPFFSTKEHGTGLGLALTKKVIESHQGAIRVESEPGRGTTFILTLPKDPRAE